MSDLEKRKEQIKKSGILSDKVKDDYLSNLEKRIKINQDKKEQKLNNEIKNLIIQREELIIKLGRV